MGTDRMGYYVNVTSAQYQELREALAELEITNDPRLVAKIRGQLAGACLDNGGSYSPDLLTGPVKFPVDLRVIDSPLTLA